MPDLFSVIRDMVRRGQQSEAEVSAILESESIIQSPSLLNSTAINLETADPLDRERIVGERLSELSDSLGVRYQQVCRDLRDSTRLAWTSNAHELRDILSTVLHTLAPTDDVMSQSWYEQVEGTNGPTQAQRARYVLAQNQSKDAGKTAQMQVDLINELISRIARSTYNRGSTLAHTYADHNDCVLLLFNFDALMVSLLNANGQTEGTTAIP